MGCGVQTRTQQAPPDPGAQTRPSSLSRVDGHSGPGSSRPSLARIRGAPLIDLDTALSAHFPEHPYFRPGQKEALAAVLQGRDVVAVLPTGGGKTLVYQLAGALLQGTTVVATPLIALMQDQVRRLSDEESAHPQRVASLTGAVRGDDRARLLDELRAGTLDFLFSTPEQLARDDVRRALRASKIDLFVVDEAHCISEWGFDFRPAYRELAASARAMGRPPILALTATAPEAVRTDVARELKLRDPETVARGFDRTNLYFGVVRVTDPDRRERQLAKLLTQYAGSSVVVYCTTRRESEETALALLELGINAGHYHGGMDGALREEVQRAFLEDSEYGGLDVLCATSAFGMGIDKADIRAVVHRTMPDSLESYWQEAGRAGRDGEPSDCILLYRPEDQSVHHHLHRRSRPSETTLAKMMLLLSRMEKATHNDIVTHIAEVAEVARSGVVALLEDLDRLGCITQSKSGIRFEGDAATAMESLAAHYAKQAEVETSRLEMVASYAESNTCRRRYLLNYLGDEYHGELCLRCDNCLRIAEQRETSDWDSDREAERVEADRGGPFVPGQPVRHPEWGDGSVQRVDGEVVVVRFDAVGYR
ncbi:MAG: RecQ family ATP-dependent DNA helicase, partial [Nitriliruptorales bacterium]|nr:RecQ family ATP-dependent DNA helicase [Nitriliruptorales bacterium]